MYDEQGVHVEQEIDLLAAEALGELVGTNGVDGKRRDAERARGLVNESPPRRSPRRSREDGDQLHQRRQAPQVPQDLNSRRLLRSEDDSHRSSIGVNRR
jgi:hypothetical protein